jgi:hypothetical protein
MIRKINRLFIILFFLCLFSGISRGQEKLFPEIAGWNVEVANRVYDANNLWDLIDGAADLFLEYSFIDLHYARYKNTEGIEVKAELYKHGSELDAFGMYSQERDPAYHFVQIGTQGYLEEGVLNYLDGCYYVKLSTFQKGEAPQDALLMVAKKINENLNQKNEFPKEINLLPAELKEMNSEKYVSQNFLGYSFFKSVVLGKYDSKAPFTVFVMTAENSENASAAIKQYLENANKESIVKIAEGKYEVKESQNGLIDICLRNNYLYGLIGCGDKQLRDSYLEKVNALLK